MCGLRGSCVGHRSPPGFDSCLWSGAPITVLLHEAVIDGWLATDILDQIVRQPTMESDCRRSCAAVLGYMVLEEKNIGSGNKGFAKLYECSSAALHVTQQALHADAAAAAVYKLQS